MALRPSGMHCILELYDCPAAVLDDPAAIEAALKAACRKGHLTVLKMVSHRFKPQGVTALALLSESHLAVHTWPKDGYAAVDLFSCGGKARPRRACQALARALSAGGQRLRLVARGRPNSTTTKDFPPPRHMAPWVKHRK